MLLMAASFAACSSDDDDAPKGNENCHDVMDAEAINRMNYETVCMRLLEMKVSGTDTSYVVANTAEQNIMTNEYTIKVKNKEKAEDYFNTYCVPSDSNFVVKTEGARKIVDFGKYGKIEYDGAASADVLATIKLSLGYLKTPATINLVENNGNAATPYEIGDIIRYNGKVWLCTIEYGGGDQEGRLMRFTNNDTYNVSDHWKSVAMSRNCADMTAIKGLRDLINDDGYRDLRNAVLKQFYDNPSWGDMNHMAFDHMYRTFNYTKVYFIKESNKEEWCWSCWRYPKHLWIDYFSVKDNKLKIESYYCYHEFGKIADNSNPFNGNVKTEQVTFRSSGLPGASLLWPNY